MPTPFGSPCSALGTVVVNDNADSSSGWENLHANKVGRRTQTSCAALSTKTKSNSCWMHAFVDSVEGRPRRTRGGCCQYTPHSTTTAKSFEDRTVIEVLSAEDDNRDLGVCGGREVQHAQPFPSFSADALLKNVFNLHRFSCGFSANSSLCRQFLRLSFPPAVPLFTLKNSGRTMRPSRLSRSFCQGFFHVLRGAP